MISKKHNKKKFIKYLKSLGLTVNTRTLARGNKGFFSGKRIDISKSLSNWIIHIGTGLPFSVSLFIVTTNTAFENAPPSSPSPTARFRTCVSPAITDVVSGPASFAMLMK